MDKAAHFDRVSRWLKDQFGSAETLESDAASIGTLLDRAEYDLDRLRKDLAGVMQVRDGHAESIRGDTPDDASL